LGFACPFRRAASEPQGAVLAAAGHRSLIMIT